MSKQSLEMEIALLHLEDVETPEQRIEKHKKTSRHMSEAFKKRRSEIMKDLWQNEEFREKQLEHLHNMKHTGHPQTPETRKKMSKSWTPERRKKQSETLRKALSRPDVVEKMKNRSKGKKWWHKGSKNTVSFECPGEGWLEGRAK